MSTIHSVFEKRKSAALIPYVTVGYPSVEATLSVVPLLAESGCDIVELGIPFSDPIADGVTIQRATFSALQNGVTPQLCLEVARELRQKVSIPLLFMTYFNPVYSYGIERFCEGCDSSGVDGLIVPDLPPEEGSDLEKVTEERDLDIVYLLTPTSTEERIKMVAEKSRGFIYLVSVTGVTGARDTLPDDLDSFVSQVRGVAQQPLCLGFGISTPEQAKMVARLADGVIVGSKIIQLMENDSSLLSVGEFVASLREVIDS
jgi:tryptophan synthase alpha chain